MFELAFIEQCADPGIEIAVVERFIAAVGTDNPLAISITSGNRVILPEPPKTPEDAVRLAQRFVGQAVVRAGVTQFPVGVGISDASGINVGLFDACENIAIGSALFGKVYRIVAHAHGAENAAVLSDALEAWRTGRFKDVYAFAEPDPGPLQSKAQGDAEPETAAAPADEVAPLQETETVDPNTAGIRVTLPGALLH